MSSESGLSLRKLVICLMLSVTLTGCAYTAQELLDTPESQLKIRSIQSRAFDTTDREKSLRVIIATLQDLGFVIDHADQNLGSVTGTKLDHYLLRMTVTVHPRGSTQLMVRANARYNVTPVLEPEPYQQFFAALSRAMFLDAQQVD